MAKVASPSQEKTHVNSAEQKALVGNYWNREPCGTGEIPYPRYSQQYFDEIERQRYACEPEIFSFAQFTLFRGRRILEVGTGAGTDFVQWVRAGAVASGIDLTAESIEHTKQRLAIEGLHAEDLRTGDCEALPYPDDSFDLVYSWGVIHHSPDTFKALREIVRVCKPGGVCKIMIYNRHSIAAYFLWLRKALFRARPWKSLRWCICNFVESAGTKAFTKKEIRQVLDSLPVSHVLLRTQITPYDGIGSPNGAIRLVSRLLASVLGWDRVGWFMPVQFRKSGAGAAGKVS